MLCLPILDDKTVSTISPFENISPWYAMLNFFFASLYNEKSVINDLNQLVPLERCSWVQKAWANTFPGSPQKAWACFSTLSLQGEFIKIESLSLPLHSHQFSCTLSSGSRSILNLLLLNYELDLKNNLFIILFGSGRKTFISKEYKVKGDSSGLWICSSFNYFT